MAYIQVFLFVYIYRNMGLDESDLFEETAQQHRIDPHLLIE